MKQTPATGLFNPEVLQLMRPDFNYVVEVGTSTGGLAKAYRNINSYGKYIGVEINADYANEASQYCSETIVGNIEDFTDIQFAQLSQADCWIFADVLEHLYDPWELLRKIKVNAKKEMEIITCIPNSQNWRMQVALCTGMLQYQDDGLLDRTHIRFFTRQTMIELFESTGYRIIDGMPRIFEEIPEPITVAIKSMATVIGADPEQAVNDALALQWVIRAVPA